MNFQTTQQDTCLENNRLALKKGVFQILINHPANGLLTRERIYETCI